MKDIEGDEKNRLISEIKKLKRENNSFRNQLRNIQFELKERKKELFCHEQISRIISHTTLSVDEVLTKIVNLIPPSWQFPEQTTSEIVIDRKSYKTEFFEPSEYKLKHKIEIKGRFIGELTVYFTGKPDGDPNLPFLAEEEILLGSIAEMIGIYLLKEEKKRTIEEALKKYQDLIENINDIVFEITLDGIIRFLSPSVYSVLGYHPEELTGKSLGEIVYPEDLPLLKRIYESRKNEEKRGLEFRLAKKNGDIRWVRITLRTIFENRTIIGRTGVLYDIHEQKLAEKKLVRSEQTLQLFVSSAPAAIAMFDNEMKYIAVSKRYLSDYNLTGKDLIGHSHYDIFPEITEEWKEIHKRCLKGAIEKSDEDFFQRNDGSVDWLMWEIHPWHNASGEIGGIVLFSEIITKRKQVEFALRKSEEKYRTIIESINEVIYEVDLSGNILYASQSVKQVLSYDREGVIGKNIFDFIYEDDIATVKKSLATLEERDYQYLEYRYLDRNGKIRWVRSATSPIYRNGKLAGGTGILSDITDRKKAELKLQENEKAYRNLVENINEIIFETDEKGVIKYISPQIEKILGYSQNEMIGNSVFPFVGDDVEYFKQRFALLQKEMSIRNDYLLPTKTGGECWVQISSKALYDGKKFKGAFGTVIDITEKKKLELEIRQSENQYKSLFEGNSSVLLLIDPDTGNIADANQAACRFYGWPKKELCSMKISDINILSGKEIKAEINKAKKRDKSFFAFQHRLSSGETRDVEVHSNPIDLNGKTFLFSSIYDITEQKTAQKALFESEERFKQVAEQSQNVIWETNSKGIYTYVSPAVEAVWGYKTDEIVGNKAFWEIHPENGRKEFIDACYKDIKNKRPFSNLESPIQRKDGTIYWMLTNGMPILDSQNKLLGYRGSSLNITDKKQSEAELKKSAKDLNEAQEMAQICSWEFDYETYGNKWSENTYNIYEIDRSVDPSYEYLLKNRVHPDDLHLFDEANVLIQNNLTKHKFDYRIVLPNGETKWFRNEIIPILSNGKLTGLKGINQDITEKKMSELAIKMQNDKLNAVINAIPDLIFIIDEDGTYLEYYVNNPEELLVRPEQIVGSNVYDTFSKETAEFHLEKFRTCLKNKTSVTYEYSIEAPDKNLYYEARLSPIDDHKVLVLSRNVTTNKLQNLQLARLSLAVTQSPVITVITDLQANVEYVNPAFEQVTGYKTKEVVGKNVKILQSGKTERKVYDDLWQTITAGKTWHGEWMNKKKNGELYWEEVLITPILNDKHKIINYLAVKQDITARKIADKQIADLNANLEQKVVERTNQLEDSNTKLLSEIEVRKLAEEALAQSEEKYRSVVENVKEVIFITDAQGHWTFLNNAWTDITGFTINESIGQLFVDFVYPDDREKNWMLFEPLIKREKDYCRHEIRYISKDGGFRWIEVYAQRREDENGEITGTYGTLQDVTERKRAEEFENELLQLSTKLTGLSLNEIDGALDMALRRIGQFLGADRSYIFEFDLEKKIMNNTHEWCNKGIDAEIENLQGISCTVFPKWMKVLHSQNNIVIPSVKDLPDAWSAEREILEPQGIQSLLAIPLLLEKELIGFVGLDSVKQSKTYTTAEVNVLKVWSGMLASLINNKRTESLLEQTRQNYETFFNTIDDFLFVFDEEGIIVDTNDTVLRRLGYTIDELKEQSIRTVRPKDRWDESYETLRKMLNQEIDFCSIPLVTKSGEQIPVETRVKRGFWNGKQVIFGVCKDISQIKLSEQKFSLAFQGNPAMMAISHVDTGHYLDINQAFIDMVGYPRDELIGHSNAELGLFPDPELRANILEMLNNKHGVHRMEIQFKTKSGEIKSGLLSADSFYIGKEKYLLTVTIDITERLKAEKEMRQARLEAEKANAAKSEFLSRMSHELRTPMNSILGFAQLFKMDELNSMQEKGVNHIIKSGKHLLDLINEVLDISRIEAGRLSLSLEPVAVSDIIREMMDVISPMSKKRNLNVDFASTISTNVYIRSDKQRFKQVLLNILNNAVKYNSEGGSVVIEITLHTYDNPDDKFVRVSVTDSGPGISETDLEKLFNPFERIGADKTGTEGTGLGLAVVKKLTEAMGGKVGVTSKLGSGSTFWIEFPQTKGQLENADFSAINKYGKEDVVHSGVILYIEDNISNIDLVEQTLNSQRSGIRLVTEMYGSNAVKVANENMPNVIFLDLNLPDIHGIEVLKELKANNKTMEIPVVIISADAMPQQLKRLLSLGADDYLTKPLDLKVFLEVIDKYTN